MKRFLTLLLIAPITFILYFLFLLFQGVAMENSYNKNYIDLTGSHIENASLIRCNYNAFYPEFSKVIQYKGDKNISIVFYTPIRLFSQNESQWEYSYTGATTIMKSTFSQVVDMVKSDCSQFQRAKGDYRDEDINWRYAEVEERDPVEELKDLYDEYESPEARALFKELYGDPYSLSEEEVGRVYEKIKMEGVDKKIATINENFKEFEDSVEGTVGDYEMDRFKYQYSDVITQEQRDKIIDTYGEWQGLSKEDLRHYIYKIMKDMDEDRFSL